MFKCCQHCLTYTTCRYYRECQHSTPVRLTFKRRLKLMWQDYLWDWKYMHPTFRRSLWACWKGAGR